MKYDNSKCCNRCGISYPITNSNCPKCNSNDYVIVEYRNKGLNLIIRIFLFIIFLFYSLVLAMLSSWGNNGTAGGDEEPIYLVFALIMLVLAFYALFNKKRKVKKIVTKSNN